MKQHLIIKTFLNFTLFLGSTLLLQAQNETIPLWINEIPGSKKSIDYMEATVIKEGIIDQVSKVSTPTLSVFLPEKPNGSAMVICPGGGYAFLAITKEGYKAAKWLNSIGITAFVLKYRLPSDEIMIDKTIGPLQDAQEAIRYIRRNAKKWDINPQKVGVMGYSAGGHLASTLSTHYNNVVYKAIDTTSAKPNFSVLVYPVISMNEKITHKGSRTNLLGSMPSTETIERYSNEKQINETTPPTFLVHAMDDKSVPVENSIEYFLALKKNNVLSEAHFYQTGKHGFGLGRDGTTSKYWTKHCEEWLHFNNYGTSDTVQK